MRRDHAHRSRWADLLAATRPLTWRERAYFLFWESYTALRYGVPWAGNWPDFALGVAAVLLFVMFARAAAWPDR